MKLSSGRPLSGPVITRYFMLSILVVLLMSLAGCEQFGGPGSTTTTSTTTSTTIPTVASYSLTFAGTGLASNLTVTARAFDKTTRSKIGDDVVLTWNAGASRYEGDIDFDYDYGNVTLLVFGINSSNQQVARAIVDYDVTTGGSAIPFTAAAKYELRDIGPGGGYIAVDNGTYASDGLGGFWRYVEIAPVESAGFLRWANNWSIVTGTPDKTVGSGKSNTATIVAGRSSTLVPAAWYCDTLDYNDCTDWFLPSYDELVSASSLSGDAIFLHSTSSYWTSSEGIDGDAGTNNAYYVNLSGNGPALKSATNLYVKAARYF